MTGAGRKQLVRFGARCRNADTSYCLKHYLDRYGVLVSEVEDYEREHGEGTGGTMADPKNLKIKNKTREAYRKSTPASYAVDPSARPAGYKPSPPSESPSVHNAAIRSFSAGTAPHGSAHRRVHHDRAILVGVRVWACAELNRGIVGVVTHDRGSGAYQGRRPVS